MLDLIASLDSEDETDSYTLHFDAGVQYFIEVLNENHDSLTLADSMVHLINPTGTEVAFNDDVSSRDYSSRIVYTATETGDFTVLVEAYNPGQLGSYRLIVAPDDFRGSYDGPGAAGSLVQDGSAHGSIDYPGSGGLEGDRDLFVLSMVQGLTYTLGLQAASSGQGTLNLASVELQTLSGGHLTDAASQNGISDFEMVLTNDFGSDAYYLAVTEPTAGAGGSYVLTQSEGFGTAAADLVIGTVYADAVQMLAGDDTVLLERGDDRANGGDGNDSLQGGDGNDLLIGGADSDSLRGGNDDDTLTGNDGQDHLSGGFGADIFVFLSFSDSLFHSYDMIERSAHTIAFDGAGEAGGDVIDLSAIDGDTTTEGFQHLIMDGTRGLGHAWVKDNGRYTVVLAETGAVDGVDFRLIIKDGDVLAATYDADDFVL